jgi:branched-chain amino acid transport system substrate-binding protein
MKERVEPVKDDQMELEEHLTSKTVSRREFLRLAALTGGAIGVSGGLGAMLASCGSAEETTTTSAGAPTTSATTGGPTSTDAGSSSTTVSAAVETGRSIKLGYVIPVTGALAPFAAAGKWAQKHFEDAIGDGLVCGDNKKHPIEVLLRDTQSDSNRAGQVTGDLIQNDQVDLMLASVTADTINPAADVSESMEYPLISNWTGTQAFIQGRNTPAEGFKWTYTYAFDETRVAEACVGVTKLFQTNSTIGQLLANDVEGNTWAKWCPQVLTAGGLKVVPTDQYPPGQEDFTTQIAAFKRAGCEALIASMLTPDFTNFWSQCLQQGFQPKVVYVNKALTFPEAASALGSRAENLTCDGGWTPRCSWKDSLTGMSCAELADEYEAFSGNQWSQAVTIYTLFEWAADLFKRVTDVGDKEGLVTAIRATKLATSYSTIDFTTPIVTGGTSRHQYVNAVNPPQAGSQWVKATSGKWPLDQVMVFSLAPDELPIEAAPLPIVY